MSTVLIFLGAYLALSVALTVAVRPYRVRLMKLACELCEPGHHEEVRDLAHRISIYAYSLRVAPLNVLVLSAMLLKPSWQLHKEAIEYCHDHPALMAEPRLDELYELYLVSTSAVNPAFGALALVLRQLFRLKARSYAHRRHTNEQPVIAYGQMKAATT
jgi:hypothetical protein